jgi:hypothetical protein
VAILPHSVSLDDAEASRDELEALRDVMRGDSPFPDEPPSLDDDYPIDSVDTDSRRWWAVETEPEFGPWEDVDLEPLPEMTTSGSYDLPNGQFGYTREEPC